MQVPIYKLSNKEDTVSIFFTKMKTSEVLECSEERELGKSWKYMGWKIDLPD